MFTLIWILDRRLSLSNRSQLCLWHQEHLHEAAQTKATLRQTNLFENLRQFDGHWWFIEDNEETWCSGELSKFQYWTGCSNFNILTLQDSSSTGGGMPDSSEAQLLPISGLDDTSDKVGNLAFQVSKSWRAKPVIEDEDISKVLMQPEIWKSKSGHFVVLSVDNSTSRRKLHIIVKVPNESSYILDDWKRKQNHSLFLLCVKQVNCLSRVCLFLLVSPSGRGLLSRLILKHLYSVKKSYLVNAND